MTTTNSSTSVRVKVKGMKWVSWGLKTDYSFGLPVRWKLFAELRIWVKRVKWWQSRSVFRFIKFFSHFQMTYLRIETKYCSMKSLACFKTSCGLLGSLDIRPGWEIVLPRHICGVQRAPWKKMFAKCQLNFWRLNARQKSDFYSSQN